MISAYLFLLPAISTVLWALYTKYQQRKMTDLYILSVAAFAIVVNAILVHKMIEDSLSVGWHLVQMTAASIIIPLAYTYFARQVGRQIVNSTATTLLWVLAALTFIPEIIIYNPFEPFVLPKDNLVPFSLYVISHGEKAFAMHTGEFVSIMQCLVSLLRIIPFMLMLRDHNLHFNHRVYAFGACWGIIIVFVVIESSMSYEELRSPLGSSFYFFFYGLILILTNTLIAKGYDLYPVVTDANEAVEDLNLYVQQQYSALASKLRTIMEEQQLYTNPQLSAEYVVELLQTNHTYFSQMMSSEWGMSFSEYLNKLRLAHVEKLLRDESLTIAAAATQSGFSDASYMSRKFKAKYGKTPSEWRKSH